MKLIIPKASIRDVIVDAKGNKNIVLYCDEESVFALLDNIKPVNILKYLFERQRREDNA